MKRIIALILVGLIAVLSLTGCDTQADRVSHNISKEADNFNVVRRLTVINARTDKPMFELIGRFSLSNNAYGELVVTCQTGPTEYKKHFIYVNKDWTLYVVEDVSGAFVNLFKYEINFLPEMIIPIKITKDY